MPEIIEVEKLRQFLYPAWTGNQIKKFTAPPSSPNPEKYAQTNWSRFSNIVRAGPLRYITRYGKNLWIGLSIDGLAWHIHLSSTGWFLPNNQQAADLAGRSLIDPTKFIHSTDKKHTRLRLHFTDGQVWNYIDPRTWGKFFIRRGYVPRDNSYFEDYGPDWLIDPITAMNALVQCNSSKTVKDVLTDQRITAGLGNYLACETAFRANIHPHQSWNSIEKQDRSRLAKLIPRFLQDCYNRDDHSHWAVFGMEGRGCVKCQTPISYAKDRNSSRGSYFCLSCQPLKESISFTGDTQLESMDMNS